MAERQEEHFSAQCTGLEVSVDESLQVATLRYFTPGGAFGAEVRAALGAALPQALQAVQVAEGPVILAWRSPTETLSVTADAARLAQLRVRLEGATDGCMVDLSGGLEAVRVSGERTADLLCRLGGAACVPQPGGARRGRLADVPVVTLSVRPEETLLLVDRAYLPHLMGWIRETMLDFA